MEETVGGQALIEGVMMRCGKKKAISVRKSNGEIVTVKSEPTTFFTNTIFRKIPFVRGMIVLLDSMIEGSKDLTYSASFFMEDEQETKFEKWLKKVFGEYTSKILDGMMLVISLILAIFLFVFLPTFLAKNETDYTLLLSFKEGILKVILFVSYLFIISKTKDMNRVFQYHGAEHKSVFCYESGKELTVENVKKMSRFHPRCGTNFIFLVLMVSILLFSFLDIREVWIRSVVKLMLFPLVSGISYELLRLSGKKKFVFTKILIYPGMLLQKITTKEPDDDQIEVAIAAIRAVTEKDNELGTVRGS